jgi:DNA topoisomerase-1
MSSVAAAAPTRRLRLRRSDCSAPGLRRVRRGRGFLYLGADGERVADPATLQRIHALGIPPGWREVWICGDERGHLQATGIDAAGRKQYLYHPVWREQRDRQKFLEMEDFARALPRLRAAVEVDLRSPGLTRSRVLACAVRLLDLGLFRIGSEEYAEAGGGLGLATLRREHVRVQREQIVFDYPAKSGVRRHHAVSDPDCREVIGALRRRRGGPAELLAHRQGRRWCPVHSDEINDYLKQHVGERFSAKDFRTWNATVLAAAGLAARAASTTSATGRRRVVSAVVREVAASLGNTPAVARRSYIDPRVFDRYMSGWTIAQALRGEAMRLDAAGDGRRRRLELAVLDLIEERLDSPKLRAS